MRGGVRWEVEPDVYSAVRISERSTRTIVGAEKRSVRHRWKRAIAKSRRSRALILACSPKADRADTSHNLSGLEQQRVEQLAVECNLPFYSPRSNFGAKLLPST